MKKNLTKALVIIAIITVIIGAKVYADYIMNATDVEYTKSDSTKVSVKEALDDLYTKSQQGSTKLLNMECSQTSVALSNFESQSITITNLGNVGIEVESSDSTVVTVTKNSNNQITINALSKNGDAKIYVKIPIGSKSLILEEIGVVVWNGSGAMPVSFAKVKINSSNIS